MKWAIIAVLAMTLGGIAVKARQIDPRVTDPPLPTTDGQGKLPIAGIAGKAKQQRLDPSDEGILGETTNIPNKVPNPVWVPDPSAGHYDCPDGWSEYARREPPPPPPRFGATFDQPICISGCADAKGHVFQERPSPGICVEEKK